MHSFIGILEGHDLVYIDLPDWDPALGEFPGWQALCRRAAVEQNLMTEDEAKRASFHSGIKPPEPKSYFR